MEQNEIDCNINIVWGENSDEETMQAIDEYLSNEGAYLLRWEDRATHEWMLSQYGLAPPTDVVVKDELVAEVLIKTAIHQHLDIEPTDYELSVDSIKSVH